MKETTAMEYINKIVDLSMPITSLKTPVFPGYPQPLRSTLYDLEKDGYYSCVWSFVEHTGTHMDAPAHFIKKGKTVEYVPLTSVVCRGIVLDFRNSEPRYTITEHDIKERMEKQSIKMKEARGRILLILTGYSKYAGKKKWFEHPEIGTEACKLIISAGFASLGIDAPSPDRLPFNAHKMLLQRGIVIFENLVNLEKLVGKDFLFVGAPLSLCDGSASPVRALALLTSSHI